MNPPHGKYKTYSVPQYTLFSSNNSLWDLNQPSAFQLGSVIDKEQIFIPPPKFNLELLTVKMNSTAATPTNLCAVSSTRRPVDTFCIRQTIIHLSQFHESFKSDPNNDIWGKVFVMGAEGNDLVGIDTGLALEPAKSENTISQFYQDLVDAVQYCVEKNFPSKTAFLVNLLNNFRATIVIETPRLIKHEYNQNLPTFDLTKDAWTEVFKHLDLYSLHDMMAVCRDFYHLVEEKPPKIYHEFELNTVRCAADIRIVSLKRYRKLKRFTVLPAHQSKFKKAELMQIPTEGLEECRAAGLMCLSSGDFQEFFTRVPYLRVLELSVFLAPPALSILGQQCPKLKVFINNFSDKYPEHKDPDLSKLISLRYFRGRAAELPQNLRWLEITSNVTNGMLKKLKNLERLVIHSYVNGQKLKELHSFQDLESLPLTHLGFANWASPEILPGYIRRVANLSFLGAVLPQDVPAKSIDAYHFGQDMNSFFSDFSSL